MQHFSDTIEIVEDIKSISGVKPPEETKEYLKDLAKKYIGIESDC